MAKCIYLHIGTGKTGTTALQKFVFQNRTKLTQSGLKYAASGLNGTAHHILGHLWKFGWMQQEQIDKLNAGDLWGDVKDEFHDSDQSLLISTESLATTFQNVPQSMEDISHALQDIPVKIVIYLRRQDLHMESLYNQNVKRGQGQKKFHIADMHRKRYFYYTYLTSIADHFGKENIIVRPYEKQQFAGGTIYKDFLDAIGFSWSDKFELPARDPNPRVGEKALEFLRLSNAIERPWEQKFAFNNSVIRALEGSDNISDTKDANIFIPPEERREYLSQFDEENAAVAREFLNRSDGVLFRDEISDLGTEWCTQEPLTSEELARIFIAVWAQERKKS